jgi:ubiquinone/menaquinone biosynthesis C-methylase UbiE
LNRQNPPVCNYEGSDYQKSFWDAGGREYEDQVEAIALKRLLPEQGELLLELGAGAGRNTPRYHGFDRVVLLDYSRTQLEQAQERLGDSSRYVFVAADIYRLPFAPALFDAATMIRALHHMAEPSLALHQVRQTLKENAVFILEFANKRNLKSVLRYLLRRQSWNPFSLEPVEFVALNFDFHPQSVRNWLEENDFVIEKQLTVSHFRQELLKKFVPLQLLVQMDAMAQYTGNWWQYTPSVFVKAIAAGGTNAPAEGGFFRCPKCGNLVLEEVKDGLYCSSCGSLWELRDGIYDFRQPVERD